MRFESNSYFHRPPSPSLLYVGPQVLKPTQERRIIKRNG
jgi:hypothetical protein